MKWAHRYTELNETLEQIVGDGDSIASDRGLQSLLWLESLQLMSKTGDLDLKVGDGLESHSTFYKGIEIDEGYADEMQVVKTIVMV